MSGGRFRIEVFPGGQLMKPFECFEAAAQGKIEAYFGPPSGGGTRSRRSSGFPPSRSA
jgi:TRAP-type C4-dicarboxylate transport system substrate-binding protein